jgi:hypothetical protein
MVDAEKGDTGKGNAATVGRGAGSQRAQSPWRYALMGMALPLAVIGIAAAWHFHPGWIEALAQSNRQAMQTAAPASATAAASQKDSPFLIQARQAEANTCAGVYHTLGTVAVEGSHYATQAIWSKTEADNRAIQGMTGMTYAAGTYVGPAAGVVFASPTGQKCEGIMVRVVPFQQSCEAVTALLPKGSAASSKLSDVAVYNAADPGLQVMLIPAGTGCTALTILRAGER